MNGSLQSRMILFAYSMVVIAITGLYLGYVVLPLHMQRQAAAVTLGATPVRHDSLDLAADPAETALAAHPSAGGWSTLAMMFLALPAAVGLAFSATNARLALSRAERAAWLLISILSLTLFFLTANAANVFFDNLLG